MTWREESATPATPDEPGPEPTAADRSHTSDQRQGSNSPAGLAHSEEPWANKTTAVLSHSLGAVMRLQRTCTSAITALSSWHRGHPQRGGDGQEPRAPLQDTELNPHFLVPSAAVRLPLCPHLTGRTENTSVLGAPGCGAMLLHPVPAAVPREGIILGKAPKGHLSPKGVPSSSDMTLSKKQVSSCERD